MCYPLRVERVGAGPSRERSNGRVLQRATAARGQSPRLRRGVLDYNESEARGGGAVESSARVGRARARAGSRTLQREGGGVETGGARFPRAAVAARYCGRARARVERVGVFDDEMSMMAEPPSAAPSRVDVVRFCSG